MAQLDRGKLMDAVRAATGFRGLTRQLEASAVRTGRQLASERTTRRTGAYEAGFSSRFTPSRTKTTLGKLKLDNDAAQSEIIEKGSRPHLIRVRKARVLTNTETGEFFGVQVNHPGTRPQHVIRDALLRVANGRAL